MTTAESAESNVAAPAFVRADSVDEELHLVRGLGGPGWGVLLSTQKLTPSWRVPEAPAESRLRRLVHQLLGALSDADMMRSARTVVVDDRLGQEIPTTTAELLASAVRLGAAQIAFEGSSIDLTDELREYLWSQACVGLGGAVERVELASSEATVWFKRHLPAASVDHLDGLILAELRDALSVVALSGHLPFRVEPSVLRRRLRRLEAARMVYLWFREDVCSAAGISSLSKAS